MFKNIKQLWQLFILKVYFPVATVFIYSPLVIIGLLLKSPKFTGYFLYRWGKDCYWLLGKSYVIEGLENVDPDKRYLIISNHGSIMDVPLNALIFRNPLSWVLKAELMKVPVVNIMFHLGVGIPIHRNNARESQQKMLDNINRIRKNINPNVLIYPEGTRSKTGELGVFKRGFVQVMRTYEMDILPITLSGIVNFYSYKQKFPNTDSPIKAIIHPVETYEKLKELDDKEIAKKMQDIIASAYYQ